MKYFVFVIAFFTRRLLLVFLIEFIERSKIENAQYFSQITAIGKTTGIKIKFKFTTSTLNNELT